MTATVIRRHAERAVSGPVAARFFSLFYDWTTASVPAKRAHRSFHKGTIRRQDVAKKTGNGEEASTSAIATSIDNGNVHEQQNLNNTSNAIPAASEQKQSKWEILRSSLDAEPRVYVPNEKAGDDADTSRSGPARRVRGQTTRERIEHAEALSVRKMPRASSDEATRINPSLESTQPVDGNTADGTQAQDWVSAHKVRYDMIKALILLLVDRSDLWDSVFVTRNFLLEKGVTDFDKRDVEVGNPGRPYEDCIQLARIGKDLPSDDKSKIIQDFLLSLHIRQPRGGVISITKRALADLGYQHIPKPNERPSDRIKLGKSLTPQELPFMKRLAMSPEVSAEAQKVSHSVRIAMRGMPQGVTVVTSFNPANYTPGAHRADEALCGMTVSSFSTVSLTTSSETPFPYVSFNVKMPSATYDAIRNSGYLLAHLLPATETAAQVANLFARGDRSRAEPSTAQTEGTPESSQLTSAFSVFDLLSSMPSDRASNDLQYARDPESKAPRLVIPGVTVLRCRLRRDIEFGDHVIIVAEVLDVITSPERSNESPESANRQLGLLYVNGAYREPGEGFLIHELKHEPSSHHHVYFDDPDSYTKTTEYSDAQLAASEPALETLPEEWTSQR